MKNKGNLYLASATNLHHFTTNQIVPENNAEKLIDYFDHRQKEYENFRNDRFITKTKKAWYIFPI